jgi:hypothetical protein
MCTICRKFKKGKIDVNEARDELEEQMEYLSEEHVEEIEEMLFREEDTLNYMHERRMQELEDEGVAFDEEGEYPYEEDPPEDGEQHYEEDE